MLLLTIRLVRVYRGFRCASIELICLNFRKTPSECKIWPRVVVTNDQNTCNSFKTRLLPLETEFPPFSKEIMQFTRPRDLLL